MSGLTVNHFGSEVILFGLDWDEITFYGQRHFRETNNLLCKESTL